MIFSVPPLKTRIGADVYTESGVPPPPSGSTGNARSDEWRSNVHKYAAGLALAQPELAPFLAAGVVLFDGWIAFGAFLSGDDKDSQKYQDQANAGVQAFLRRGFIPRKWINDVEFAESYARYLGTQLNALTYKQDVDVMMLCTDFGLSMIETASQPAVLARLKKGNASPFSGYNPAVPVGIYNSYIDIDLVALIAQARFGGDFASRKKNVSDFVGGFCKKVDCSAWPTDMAGQAYFAATLTAYAWQNQGGRSRGYYLSVGGAAQGADGKPIKVVPAAASPTAPSSVGVGTVAVVGGGAYLAYRYAWPMIKRRFFEK